MNKVLVSLSALGIATVCVAGCSSETPAPEPEQKEVASASTPRPEGDPKLSDYTVQDPYNPACYYTYSDVVPAYIAYADVHCSGWTGKVFCEYDSLSSVYGPGWGTCQCYNYDCRAEEKRGRCYSYWCW
jgi:hypothetical protein